MREHLSDSESNDWLPQRLLSIWTRPTATLRFILANYPDKYVATLLALGGIARVVDRAARQHGGDHLALAKVSPLSLVVGALSGWLTYYVYGWALSIVGHWLGGPADTEKMRTVLAWALVPIVTGLGLVVLYIAFFNNELFAVAPAEAKAIRSYSEIVLLVVQGVFSAWALVILSKGIQLLQGFSPGRALVNMLLPGVLFIGFIILVAKVVQF